MGKSSKDKRDIYYRLAKEQNWRARSAFKLIQLDEEFDLFSYADPSSCTRVVDLCAAPGSWSQVLSRVMIKGESFGRRTWVEKQQRFTKRLDALDNPDISGLSLAEKPEAVLQPRENVKIIAIDLQPMSQLEGVELLQADITHHTTVGRLLQALDPEYDPSDEKNTHRVDLVLSDGAPDVTGLHDMDIYVQAQLLNAALNLAMRVLRPGGKFVAKIFRGKNVDTIYAQLRVVFETVHVAKPRSSRASSLEAFVVCQGFKLPAKLKPNPPIPQPVRQERETRPESQTRTVAANGNTHLHFEFEDADANCWIAPFLACGDLSAWDADATYQLPKGHVSLDPVQLPTAPPYKEALEMKRAAGGAYGKTKNFASTKKNGSGQVPDQ